MTTKKGNFKLAIMSLRSNKWRSFLTMLGVIVGVVAVVITVGIGEGTKRQFGEQLNSFGKNLITVKPGVQQPHTAANALSGGDLLFGMSSASGLTTQDVQTTDKTPGIGVVAPLGVVSGMVTSETGKPLENSLVIATSSDLPRALNTPVKYGDFFDMSDTDAHAAVLGKHAARELFNQDVPLAHSFTFRGQQFVVRGVFDDFASGPLSPTGNFNDAIFIPADAARELTDNAVQFYAILTKPSAGTGLDAAAASLRKNLQAAHGGQNDLSVLTPKQTIAAGADKLALLTTLITGVAAVALLVGGVGIMNIMLVSVTERMHEIGLRKAVGATNRQILNQFMLEAAVLSIAGGVFGIIGSLVIDALLLAYTSIRPVISWHAMLLAFVISAIIGVVFGTAPAIKAARKDPIDALRHD